MIGYQQQYYGQPNTAYDFTAHDPREAQKKISKLQEQKVYRLWLFITDYQQL